MIYIDTREKKNTHILQYFERNGIAYEKKKLEVCDYTVDGNILIERKQNLLELAGNITKENGRRIKAEFSRVPPNATVYVLVEENIHTLEDVQKWSSKYSKLHGATLYRYLVSYQRRHGLQYIFCHKNSSGKIISKLLGIKGGG